MKIIQKERRRPTCLWYLDKTKEWEFQSFLPHAVVMGFCLKNSPLSGYGRQCNACGFPVKRGCWIFELCGAFYKLKTQSRVCTTVTSSSKIPQPIMQRNAFTYDHLCIYTSRARVRFHLVYVFSCEFSIALVNQSYQCVFPKCEKGSSE